MQRKGRNGKLCGLRERGQEKEMWSQRQPFHSVVSGCAFCSGSMTFPLVL